MEKEATEKEIQYRNDNQYFKEAQKDKEAWEEQFLTDQHTYKKELDSLRDRNNELVLQQHELS